MTVRWAQITGIVSALAVGEGYAAVSQEQAKPVAQAKPATQAEQKKPKRLDILAASSNREEATSTTNLKSAVITDEEEGTQFRAEQMKIRDKKGVETMDATGNLIVTDKQADVTGEKVTVYFARSKRLAVVTGNVVIQVKPKSEQKEPKAPNAPVGPMPVVLQDN